jgi:hypothetical protein
VAPKFPDEDLNILYIEWQYDDFDDDDVYDLDEHYPEENDWEDRDDI